MPEVIITKTRTKEINPDMSQTIKVVTEKQVQQPAKPVVADQISLQSYMLLGAICAVVVYGVVEVIKEFIKARLKVKGKDKPWYYLAMIRSLSIGIGGLSGYVLSDSFGAGPQFAVMAGCAAGAMSTLIVGVIKAKAKKAISK